MDVGPLKHRHYVGIRARVAPSALGATLGELLPAVSQFLREQGVPPASAPTLFFHHHDEEVGVFEIQAGMFVAEEQPGSGRVEAGSVEASEVVRCLHRGPYQRLGETHDAVRSWIVAQGRSSGTPRWESYLNDPSVVPAEELLTEVVFPLQAEG